MKDYRDEGDTALKEYADDVTDAKDRAPVADVAHADWSSAT